MSDDDDPPTAGRPPRSYSQSEWRLLEPLVDALLDTPPSERLALLVAASGGDPARQRELELLLAECERTYPLLDAPAAARFSELLDDDAVSVSQVVAERYRITRKLRRGGMATVYLAVDLRHGRDVALKVIRAELAVSLGTGRFLREIEIVARLHHPHIVPLYDSGAADGILYYVMPYEEGQSLRERLTRDGPLLVGDALVILGDICGALAYAHERGIVHRDIKPDNVLLSGRHAMVTDFGVAKALSDAVGGEQRPGHAALADGFTTTGATLGTPAYMAPEQIVGAPAIDHRADIYALGVLACEILTGRPPFQSEEPREVLARHLSLTPESLATRRNGIPPALDAVVMKCLAKRPADRWQSADELLARFAEVASTNASRAAHPATTADAAFPNASRVAPRRRRLRVAAIAIPLVIALFAAVWQITRRRDAPHPAEPSIAILPLSNLSPMAADVALADRMTEELISTLSRGGSVRVIASSSVAPFRAHTMDVRAIADSLGVSNILEGAFGKIGSALRVEVRLVDSRNGSIRWSQRYDREFKDILLVEDEIARAVAGELGLRFDREKQLVRHKTKSSAAYELYLRGWDPVLLRNQAGILAAQRLFEEAIAADSLYAAAHASLALMYVRRARTANDPGMQPRQLLAVAESSARKAIRLDDSLAEAHYALGQVLETTLHFPAAEREVRRAVALDPGRSVYRRRLAYLKAWTGPPGAELAEARRALETDPLNPYAILAVGGGLYGLRRYDEALAMHEKVAAITPPLQGVSFGLAQLYAKKQMWTRAVAVLRPQAEDGDPAFIGLLGYMLAHAGKRDEANRILSGLHARQQRTATGAFEIATVYTGLGDRDQAFAWLDRSIDDYSINSMVMGPTFEELHDDPRFARLRARLGLDP